jgi:hypothetical protein
MPKPPPPRIDFSSPTSFATFTLRERLPRIAERVAAEPHWSAAVRKSLRALARSLPEGAPPAELGRGTADAGFWQERMRAVSGARWLELSFFEAEFMFYRALLDAVEQAEPFAPDPFAAIKRAALERAQPDVARAARDALRLGSWTREAFRLAVRWALHGNVADLSQLATTAPEHVRAPLVDDLDAFVASSLAPDQSGRLEIVLDNAGSELIGDLVLIDQLLRALPQASVRVHLKPAPIFVSDATRADFDATLERLCADGTDAIAGFGHRLRCELEVGRLVASADPQWCLPLCFGELSGTLFEQLRGAAALILKGDLNYRRYVEDRRWPLDSPSSVHRVRALPPTLCVRVMKSELAVGLPAALTRDLAVADPEWMHSGRNSLIQLFR